MSYHFRIWREVFRPGGRPMPPKEAIDLTLPGRGDKQFGIDKIEKGVLTLRPTGPPDATAGDRPTESAIEGKAGIMLEVERPAKK